MFKNLTGKIRFLLQWGSMIMLIIDVIEYALKKFEGAKYPDWQTKSQVIDKIVEVEKVTTEGKSDISKKEENVYS